MIRAIALVVACLTLPGSVDPVSASKDRPNTAREWYERASELTRTRQRDQAAKAFDRSVALDPEDPYIYCSRATIFNRTAQPDKALASSREAIAVDPGHIGALFNMATALRELGRHDEAEAVLERARKATPSPAR